MNGKGGSAPISVVETAIKQKLDAEESEGQVKYDSVWCVMDVEAPEPHDTLNDALIKATENGLKVALSNPCFEFWLLLHSVKTSRFFDNNKAVLRELRKHHPNYAKGDDSIFQRIYPDTDTAITNTESILKEKGCSENLLNCNPSTHVHRLVQELRRINDGSAK